MRAPWHARCTRLVTWERKPGQKKGHSVNRAERACPAPGLLRRRAVDRAKASAARLHRRHIEMGRREASTIVVGALTSALQPTCVVLQAGRLMSAACGRSAPTITHASLALCTLHNRVVVQCARCSSCAMHELCKPSCVTMRKPVAQSVGGRRTRVAGPALGIRQPKSRQNTLSSSFQTISGLCDGTWNGTC